MTDQLTAEGLEQLHAVASEHERSAGQVASARPGSPTPERT
jgi:hypothetical protein